MRSLLSLRSALRLRSLHGGFTLIELTVSVAVFSVAILIITSALLGVVDASRKAQTVRAAIDNVGSSVDNMSRLMRIGTTYHCGCLGSGGALIECGTATPANISVNKDCPPASGGGEFLAFEGAGGSRSTSDDQIVFRRGTWPDTGYGRIERSDDGGANYYVTTGANTDVKELTFSVIGTQPDNSQPSVVIFMKTDTDTGGIPTTLAVQTSVTQRTPNLSEGSAFGFGTSIVTPCVPENPASLNCKDGVDNDCNGLTDCEDWTNGCSSNSVCTSGEDCTDGIDNDNDNKTDCEDFDCEAKSSNHVFCLELSCTDKIDSNDHCCGPVGTTAVGGCNNPGPGETGSVCTTNTQCKSKQCISGKCSGCGWDSSESLNKGTSDCQDPDYKWCHPALNPGAGCAPENCSNGIDDNGDGYIDCKDNLGCRGNPYCKEEGANCTDGKDNDLDGAKDCLDTALCCKYAGCLGQGKCATVAKDTACTSDSQCGGGRCIAGKCNGIAGEH